MLFRALQAAKTTWRLNNISFTTITLTITSYILILIKYSQLLFYC
ncbi:hypothetical protein rpr22_0315 [Rickettsia prowazekii str. Rp22]|uniref:Uncharacterized protein n=1 Tax=Rickettsia prowazekii (strain Rp22) TaxID=449216 RepID=D5AWM6_RICPP|nr:hypothetical protein rpr22_0315 [Rickettsia prowazekii str. Rp22]